MRNAAFVASFMSMSTAALAEVPKVVTDIAPVHGLVSMVMKGVETPDVLLGPNASAHDFALRPSQAAQVASADVIIWVGASLSPQLEDALNTLATDAEVIRLDQLEGSNFLDFRALEDFAEDHDDHEGHEDHEEHAEHDDHEEHAEHEEHADHDDHKDHAEHDEHEDHAEHDDHKDHDHAGVDPHLWLDPENAVIWLSVIADSLSAADPENAQTYKANAQTAIADIDDVSLSIKTRIDAAPASEFLVSHDAFQYFETRFERTAIGAVSLSDAQSPSPKHLGELRAKIEQANVSCVLVEPLTNTGLIDAAAGSTKLAAIEVDPMGAGLPLGDTFYPALIEKMGEAFVSCLNPE